MSGRVTDANGDAIADAAVRVLNESNAVVAQGTTGDDGEHSFDNLPVGNYRLHVDRAGFQPVQIQNLQTHAGANAQNATLNVGAATEVVAVEAAPPPNRRNLSRLQEFAKGPRAGGIGGGMAAGMIGGLSNTESMGRASKTDRFARADIYNEQQGQDAAAKTKGTCHDSQELIGAGANPTDGDRRRESFALE